MARPCSRACFASNGPGQFAKRVRSARAVAVPGAYSLRTDLACVSTTVSPAPGAMPLVSSQRVPGTRTTSSGFWRPQMNVRPAAGAHAALSAAALAAPGACACSGSDGRMKVQTIARAGDNVFIGANLSGRRDSILNAVQRTIVYLALAAVLSPAPLAAGLPPARQAAAQITAPADRRVTSRVVVALPADDAELAVDGNTMPGKGSSREFDTPPLDAGSERQLTFTATWMPNTYTTMTRSKTVSFRPGQAVRVDLSVEAPGDRVRVIYVPTPTEVAEAMVDLAGVRPDDVVFEPGCGDARITIAAIRKGARRAICVDIDGERARESRANVAAAGLADRIDVREGDALDVKDLSDVSVVLLYMGDHFNLLIRPVLWRELKVGSRIVSHRFGMGDWQPDKTITVGDGIYELHLWTITEQMKRTLTR